MPTIGWRHRYFTRDRSALAIDKLWKPGDSIQLAIGQGDLLVTPLQMARFYALLANGGKLVTPHVLMDVENPNGHDRARLPAPPAPRPIRTSTLPRSRSSSRGSGRRRTSLRHLVRRLRAASRSRSPARPGRREKVVRLPGYTGLQDQSWWCGYGPTDDAKLVVCAVIENGGHGGTAAAPAAAQVFASFFNVKVSPRPQQTD